MQCYVTYLNMRQGEFLPGDNIVSVSVIASFTSSNRMNSTRVKNWDGS